MIYWFRQGGHIFEVEILLIPLTIIGIWLIFTAFSRGYFLDVRSTSGRKRFAFNSDVDLKQLADFIDNAKSYGLVIEQEHVRMT